LRSSYPPKKRIRSRSRLIAGPAKTIKTLSESIEDLVREDVDLTAYSGIGKAKPEYRTHLPL